MSRDFAKKFTSCKKKKKKAKEKKIPYEIFIVHLGFSWIFYEYDHLTIEY